MLLHKKKLTKSERMGSSPILPLLIKMMIPPMIGMAIQALYNVVDSIYIGHISTQALSAVSLAFPLQMIIIAVSVGTGAGATSLISRTLGKGNKKKADEIAEHVLFIAITYGILMAIVGFFFAEHFYGLFTANKELLSFGVPYIRIILTGSIVLFFPMLASSVLRGEGNTFLPMLIIAFGAILNLILDPLLIFGIGPFPEMGVRGAAYATVISRFISGIFVIMIFFKKNNELKPRLIGYLLKIKLFREIYRIGLPALVMQLLFSVLLIGLNKILIDFGTVAVAAFGIFFRLQSFVLMPIFGLGQAVMPLVGYNYGKKNRERVLKTIKYALALAIIITIPAFIIFQTIPTGLIRLFNNDYELLNVGIVALKRMSIAFLFTTPIVITIVSFQALGRGLASLLLTLLRSVVLLFPISYLFGKYFGLNMVWFAYPLTEGVSMVVSLLWLYLTLKKVFGKKGEIVDLVNFTT